MEMFHAIVWTKDEGDTSPEKHAEAYFSSLQAAQDFVNDFNSDELFMGLPLPRFDSAKIERFILQEGWTKYNFKGYAMKRRDGDWDISALV